MNRKLIYIALVLGASLLAILLLKDDVSLVFDEPIINDAGEYVIDLTEEGFVPDNIIINVGDTVRFTTSMDRPFWPASNIHPHHDVYPEFDPKRPIDPSDSWAFSFDKPGRWAFHDHIYAYFSGSVFVSDDDFTFEEVSKCFEFKSLRSYERKGCFEDFNVNYISFMSANDAFTVLQRAYELDPALAHSFDGCHQHSHVIGDIAYQEYLELDSVKEANWSEELITMCGAGFVHGFLEHYTEGLSDLSSVNDFCIALGDAYPERSNIILSNCYHGVGHGFIIKPAYNSKEWGDDIAIAKPAIEKCRENIAEYGYLALERCYSGVLNSIAFWEATDLYGLSREEQKQYPFKLCDALGEDVRELCYMEESGVFANELNFDFRLVMEKYGEHLTDYEKKAAMISATVPAYLYENTDGLDDDGFIDFCREVDEEIRYDCVEALVEGYLSGSVRTDGYLDAIELCQNDKLDNDEKTICYSRLFLRGVFIYPIDLMENICSEFEEEYKYICDFGDETLPINYLDSLKRR